jgi:hypothetical protein
MPTIPERHITTVYPSVAATGVGKLLGSLSNCLKVGNVTVSAILFAPLVAPLAVLIYLGQKVFGHRYEMTDRALKNWAAMSERLDGEAALADIAEIEIAQSSGQTFYHAADLRLLNAAGDAVLVLEGVPRADVFRRLILEARDARGYTEAALATIAARQPA